MVTNQAGSGSGGGDLQGVPSQAYIVTGRKGDKGCRVARLGAYGPYQLLLLLLELGLEIGRSLEKCFVDPHRLLSVRGCGEVMGLHGFRASDVVNGCSVMRGCSAVRGCTQML